ncbi:unnamed protein product [Phytophthora lilii]|uniref:Unnamed protein product n=1 Tax=Phytophthora lilii TaxID=2077276 RepID=A0A9W6U2G5_9STRA|nr:unnamed protein product [Phytophthora lilii]
MANKPKNDTSANSTAADIAIAQEFQDITSPANGSIAHGPVLVVQGVNDTAIFKEVTEHAWQRACDDGSEVHLSLYPKQDHSGVLTAAAPEWLDWVDARFRGEKTVGACSKQTKSAFDYEFVRAVPEVNLATTTLN